MRFHLNIVSSYFQILIDKLRIISDTISLQLEPAQMMKCLVSNNFEVGDEISIGYQSDSSINDTFELSSQDISLVLISLWKFSLNTFLIFHII